MKAVFKIDDPFVDKTAIEFTPMADYAVRELKERIRNAEIKSRIRRLTAHVVNDETGAEE